MLPTDHRTDIYSFALVVYEMLTCKNPCAGEHDTSQAVRYNQVHRVPSPPSSLNPALSADVDRVLLKALSKDPDARQQMMTKFVGDLLQALRPGRQMPRWAYAVGGAVILLLALILGRGPLTDMWSTAMAQRTARANVRSTATAVARSTATANARSTGIAIVQSTATAHARSTEMAIVGLTGTTNARSTGTAMVRSTATANARSTGTAVARSTAAAEAQSTEIAIAGLTATANARSSGTAMAQSRATANSRSTATATWLPPSLAPTVVPPTRTPLPPTATAELTATTTRIRTPTPTPSPTPTATLRATATLTRTPAPTRTLTKAPILGNVTIKIEGLDKWGLECSTLIFFKGQQDILRVPLRDHLDGPVTVPRGADWFKFEGSPDGKCPWSKFGLKDKDRNPNQVKMDSDAITLVFAPTGKREGGGGGDDDYQPWP